jgi:hypothetical protein
MPVDKEETTSSILRLDSSTICPKQPVDITSSTMLNYAEDVNLPGRRRGQHNKFCVEYSGFDDCSGHSTSA